MRRILLTFVLAHTELCLGWTAVPRLGGLRGHRTAARAPPVVAAGDAWALLFDCDGVLADTERDGHRIAFNQAFKENELGFEWGVDEYGRLCEVGGGKERSTFYMNKEAAPPQKPQLPAPPPPWPSPLAPCWVVVTFCILCA